MAHKSKTQRAKATARKQARKEQEAREAEIALAAEAAEESGAEVEVVAKKAEKKAEKKDQSKAKAVAQIEKKVEDKPAKKKKRGKILQFFFDVKSEMKRVTWPSRQDVLRWSGVVVVALLFFGIFTAVLDNIIITPALVALSGLGA